MNYETILKPFAGLSNDELYSILKLRTEVFIVEQQCIFQDTDNKDQQSYHLMLWNEGMLSGYARIAPAGITYDEASIGRVATSPQSRGGGFGRILMNAAIASCRELFGDAVIRIGAQVYIKKFYTSLGFTEDGDIYDEDGIDHIEMLLLPGN